MALEHNALYACDAPYCAPPHQGPLNSLQPSRLTAPGPEESQVTIPQGGKRLAMYVCSTSCILIFGEQLFPKGLSPIRGYIFALSLRLTA